MPSCALEIGRTAGGPAWTSGDGPPGAAALPGIDTKSPGGSHARAVQEQGVPTICLSKLLEHNRRECRSRRFQQPHGRGLGCGAQARAHPPLR